MTRKKPTSGAGEALHADEPLRGGSYIRRADGTLDRVEFTLDAASAPEVDDASRAASEEQADG